MEKQAGAGRGGDGQETVGAGQTKLPTSAHVLCGWPLLLVAVGGAIGGLLGGMAYGINMMVYKTQLPVPAKVALNIVTGAAAIVLWMVAVAAIRSSMAD